MVQKEVADRFLAMENSKKYGYYTVFLNNYYDTCKIIDANKFCFDPAPKVDSTVVQLIKKEKPLINDVEFFNFLKKCFSEKRKTLKNNLKELFSNELLTIYHKYNYQDNIRSEGASIEFFIDVYLYLLNNNQI